MPCRAVLRRELAAAEGWEEGGAGFYWLPLCMTSAPNVVMQPFPARTAAKSVLLRRHEPVTSPCGRSEIGGIALTSSRVDITWLER